MSDIQLLQEGIYLMIAGMGFVLLFLFILIYAISLMSIIINRFFPDTPTTDKNLILPTQDNQIEKLRPVIVAAIHHHRRKQGLK